MTYETMTRATDAAGNEVRINWARFLSRSYADRYLYGDGPAIPVEQGTGIDAHSVPLPGYEN